MKKKIIDVKTELKKPKTFVQKSTVTKPKRFPDVYPFLRPHSQEALKEVLGDLKFVTGREDFHPFSCSTSSFTTGYMRPEERDEARSRRTSSRLSLTLTVGPRNTKRN